MYSAVPQKVLSPVTRRRREDARVNACRRWGRWGARTSLGARGQAEVGEDAVALLGQQHVLRLDVPVRHVLGLLVRHAQTSIRRRSRKLPGHDMQHHPSPHAPPRCAWCAWLTRYSSARRISAAKIRAVPSSNLEHTGTHRNTPNTTSSSPSHRRSFDSGRVCVLECVCVGGGACVCVSRCNGGGRGPFPLLELGEDGAAGEVSDHHKQVRVVLCGAEGGLDERVQRIEPTHEVRRAKS